MVSMKDKLAAHKKKKSKTGKGNARVESISELFGVDGGVVELVAKAKDEGRLLSLSFNEFIPDPNQPRKTFNQDRIDELRISIETKGQLQPILVGSQLPDGKYPIIAGERRWRAISESSVIDEVVAIVCSRDVDELHLLLMQIDENNQREQIPAIENAIAMKRVVDICKSEGKDQAYAAKLLNVSPAQVSKHIALLDAPDIVTKLSIHGETQDIEVLYRLSKAYENKPEDVGKLIEQWRRGELKTSLRKASKELVDKARQEKNKSKDGWVGRKTQKPSKVENTEPKLEKASGVRLGLDKDEFTLTVEVGDKKMSFVVDADTVTSLKNDIDKNWRD